METISLENMAWNIIWDAFKPRKIKCMQKNITYYAMYIIKFETEDSVPSKKSDPDNMTSE